MSDDVKINVQSGSGENHPLAKIFVWTDTPGAKKNFIWISVVGLIITAALMVIYPNKHPAPWEVGPMKLIAYGVIGGFAYTFVVFSAKPLFNMLSRPENFYGEGDDHDV